VPGLVVVHLSAWLYEPWVSLVSLSSIFLLDFFTYRAVGQSGGPLVYASGITPESGPRSFSLLFSTLCPSSLKTLGDDLYPCRRFCASV
jgi:hypothetical protein